VNVALLVTVGALRSCAIALCVGRIALKPVLVVCNFLKKKKGGVRWLS